MENYAETHKTRANLVIHLIMVPIFLLASTGVLWGAVSMHYVFTFMCIMWASFALVCQHYGHIMETGNKPPVQIQQGPPPEAAQPQTNVKQVLMDLVREQFYTFPAFLLSGDLKKAWKDNKSMS